MDGTVLVADDDRTIRTVLTQALTRAGCKVHATSSIVTLMRWVDEGKGELVISDVMMPDGNGLESLPKIVEKRPGLPVIIISAQNNIMTAIQATEADAYDYLPKPFHMAIDTGGQFITFPMGRYLFDGRLRAQQLRHVACGDVHFRCGQAKPAHDVFQLPHIAGP